MQVYTESKDTSLGAMIKGELAKKHMAVKALNKQFNGVKSQGNTNVPKQRDNAGKWPKKGVNGHSQQQLKPKKKPCLCLYCYYSLLRPDVQQKVDNVICYLNPEKTRKVNFEWTCEYGKERQRTIA
jgi:hypothetical protein